MRSGVLLLACALVACTDDTEPLDPNRRNDDASVDAGPACATFLDCTDDFPNLAGCPDRNFCICGSYVTCERSRCVAFANEFCGDAGDPWDGDQTDSGLMSCTEASGCGDRRSIESCSSPGFVSSTSCLEGICVAECGSGPRTCEVTSPTCLACGMMPEVCVNECASAGIMRRYRIEEATCTSFVGTEVTVVDDPGTSCSYVATVTTTGLELGRYHLLTDFTYLADFPQFGGPCTGFSYPTSAERIVFNCPYCQFLFGL